jgi:hypothetical protein
LKTIFVTGGNGLLGFKLLAESEGKYQTVSLDLRKAPLILLGMVFYTWRFIRGPHRSGLSTEKRNC